MIPLTKNEEKMHNKQKKCYISKKRFSTNDNKIIVIILENTEVVLIIFVI